MKKYDWVIIQQDYDNNLSYRDLQIKYGMSSYTITMAVRRGDLKTRSKNAAGVIAAVLHPTVHTEEFKDSQRQIALKRHAAGWDNKAGRCKKYKYFSIIAGDITLDGTWELAVAKWLDFKGYTWKRNTKRFSYIHLNGKDSHYIPDFWVEELGGYLEVKGYETELDRCKWLQFTESLVIWKAKEIKLIMEEWSSDL